MTRKTTIVYSAEIPTELLHAFVQHIRDFDAAHADCHFKIHANPDAATTVAELQAALQIEPPLAVVRTIRKQ